MNEEETTPNFPVEYTLLYIEALKLWKENRRLKQELAELKGTATKETS